jgi:predicted alpha/beta-fold hydrolase
MVRCIKLTLPLIESTYRPPFYLFNGHMETIVPSMFRKISDVVYTRERLELPDGDFVDLDWLRQGSKRLMIVSHGLEGSSERHYSKGMARYFSRNGWDALAWNCRSCSGEMNRLPRFYHHGATEDLTCVINHSISRGYHEIVLVGISMGGSMTLKYLGENTSTLPSQIQAGIAFSVPCHLASSASELDRPEKRFYLKRFLKKLSKKIKAKESMFPGIVSHERFEQIKSFREFDNRYTAPLHGFENADDFYQRASCLPHLQSIKVPTLLVNALNDPFLTKECYPKMLASDHDLLYLETPSRGGHTGFCLIGKIENGMEERALGFVQSLSANRRP